MLWKFCIPKFQIKLIMISDNESEARPKSVQSPPVVVLILNSYQQIIIVETRKEVELCVSVKPELKWRSGTF